MNAGEEFVLKGDVGRFETNLPGDVVVDSGGQSPRSPVSMAHGAGYTCSLRSDEPSNMVQAGQNDSDHGTPETQ